MTAAPRRFRLSCGDTELPITAATVEDLANEIGVRVYLYDTAELLADQAWAGREAVHGFIKLEEVWG